MGVPTTSTDAVAPGERFDFWRELISSTFVPLTAEPVGGRTFTGALTHARAGELSMTFVRSSGQHVRRTRTLINAATDEYLLASLQLQGRGVVTQDGREAILTAGSMACYDSTRPYLLHFDTDFQQLVVQVPRSALTAQVPQRLSQTGVATPLGRDSPAAPIFDFLLALARQAERGLPIDAGLIGSAVGLLGTALRLGAQGGSPTEDLVLARITAFLRRHLGDPDLDVTAIAQACRISRRTLFRLLAPHGGVAAYLTALRIERARQVLISHPHRTVAAIAAECGFAGEAQFHRTFKRLTGTTPHAFRTTRSTPSLGAGPTTSR